MNNKNIIDSYINNNSDKDFQLRYCHEYSVT